MEILKSKNIITEIKYLLEGLKRFELAEERISEFEDRFCKLKNHREKNEENEPSFRDLGHHQIYQHTSNGNTRKRGKKREEIFKEKHG